MSTKKRIPIPRDLKRGDSIVDNHGVKREFLCYDSQGDICVSGGIFQRNGYRCFEEMGYAVKIIRAQPVVETPKPKKPKPDPDVEYLRRVVADPATTKRLRKIAKRLESLG